MSIDVKFWNEIFLFYGIETDELLSLLEFITVETKNVKTGEIIYSPDCYEEKVGFVVSGACTVERIRSDGANLRLNVLNKFDSFGILTLFSSNSGFPSQVKAKKESIITFISKKDILRLIERNSRVALNIINFMGNKISFLNDKISTFSSDNVEQKFANFLLLEFKKNKSESFCLNIKRTAESINSGRASLYRAIELFEKKSLIKVESKKIYILDLDGLERISK